LRIRGGASAARLPPGPALPSRAQRQILRDEALRPVGERLDGVDDCGLALADRGLLGLEAGGDRKPLLGRLDRARLADHVKPVGLAVRKLHHCGGVVLRDIDADRGFRERGLPVRPALRRR
jgi:hypothetical protein